ncbi:lysophospholipase L1-like esterase [Arenibacter algicola]|uniref:Lysophospholipase L1-like esterase n=1 Tax=Arenibacter algicola TaxID=616991 RepID=A0ABY3AFW9_9FLAO
MKTYYILFLLIVFVPQRSSAQIMDDSGTYLNPIKTELQKKWPANRTVNLVFHGHSVPSGYFRTPHVSTLDSYPYLTLKNVKDLYPHAVVNSITTSIGGEQSEQGAKRFKDDVLSHKPDVLFIDYALNDRRIGLTRAKKAWEKMIQEAIAYGTKVILLTPTPDLNEDIQSPNSELAKYSGQIRELAKKYKIGLVDSYILFQKIAKTEDLNTYMAQGNHINKKGHQVVVKAILDLFNSESK